MLKIIQERSNHLSKKKRTDKNKLIRSRALQTIIGTSQSLNKDEVQDVKHSTVEEMEKELHKNAEHQMEYVNDLKNKALKK